MWSADGKELFYRNRSTLMVVPVETRGRFEAGTPRPLFNGVYRMRSDTGISYGVDPKGERFLMIRSAEEGDSTDNVRIVLNWMEDVRRLVSTRH